MFQASVIGSRNCQDWEGVCTVLDDFLRRMGPFLLLSGGANGGDALGQAWAMARGVPYLIYAADWQREGKAAGFNRNTFLAEDGDWIIAFWDHQSRGTKDTLDKARRLGKEIIVVPLNTEGLIVSAPQHWARQRKEPEVELELG